MDIWRRFNRRDPCPICEGARNDCRQSPSGLLHCWNSQPADESKFVSRGQDKSGFYMWAEKSRVEAWSNDKLRESKEQRLREYENRREKEKTMRKLSLTTAERDIAIRKILSELTLSAEHREHLHSRDMSDELISAGFYSSVSPWQKLNHKVDSRLAGVQDGVRLNLGVSGILCPIPNNQGELVGWQIRLDDKSRATLPKYIWASSKDYSVHLQNGELPLAFYKASNKVHPIVSKWVKKSTLPIALTEGVAFKPAITAQRLGIYTIGASSGNFASSLQTLKDYLVYINQKTYQGQIIMPILFADAGSISNPNILKIYENTHREFKNLRYQLKVAWWNQTDKSVGDIDEITEITLSSIKLISHENFTNLAKKAI